MSRDTITIKRGVEWYSMHPSMLVAYDHWREICEALGVPAVVTSAREGRHRPGSRHYLGRAIDLRTRDMTREQAETAAARLQELLGPLYRVILEQDHLHVQTIATHD